MGVVTFAVLSMCAGLVYGHSSSCQTPDGKNGECISITNCEPLQTLLNKSNKTDIELNLLTRSHCGSLEDVPFVSKVCCPTQVQTEPVYNETCSTPGGDLGRCVSIYSCPHIANMLRPPVRQETVDFVLKSRCKNKEKYSVCCGPRPLDDRAASADPCQAEMTAFPPDLGSGCCGQWSSVGNKIVGGLATAIDEHPWTAIIESINNEDRRISQLCGGALISGKYVLTAAHCIAGKILDTETPNAVRLGDYNVTNEGKDCTAAPGGGEDCTDGDTRILIDRIIPHPKYDPSKSKRHDIGLIRLKKTAPFTDFIRPICLPIKDLTLPENTPSDFSLFAVGWGATETKRQSDVKVHVNVPFISQEKCQPAYNRTGRTTLLWRGQLCAGGIKSIDTCNGDSGGPLVYEDLNIFQIIGIVSFGPVPCGLGGVPAIYSNVYEYLDWIKSVIVP